MTNAELRNIAITIKQQIGFPSWAASGARKAMILPADECLGGIRFTTGTGHKAIEIRLDYNDTYSVKYLSKRTEKVIHEAEGIYCDQLSLLVYEMTHGLFQNA